MPLRHSRSSAILVLLVRYCSCLYFEIHIATLSRLLFIPMSIAIVPLSTLFTPLSTYASIYNGIACGLLLRNAMPGFLDTDCFLPGYEGSDRLPAPQFFSLGACLKGYVTQSPSLMAVRQRRHAALSRSSRCWVWLTISQEDLRIPAIKMAMTGA